MPANDKMGPGHSYNAQVHYRIIQAIKLGATKELAAKAGGIGARTLTRWLSDAKRNGEESAFAGLYQDVIEAEASGATHALACIVKAAKSGRWQAAAWLLERKYGYRRDGVKELREYATIPGSLETHSAEILGEIRRLRISATDDGSHVAAANLLRMEAEMVQTQRAEEVAAEEAQHAKADESELLEIIKSSVEDMPRAVLDQLAKIIEAKRRRAS